MAQVILGELPKIPEEINAVTAVELGGRYGACREGIHTVVKALGDRSVPFADALEFGRANGLGEAVEFAEERIFSGDGSGYGSGDGYGDGYGSGYGYGYGDGSGDG